MFEILRRLFWGAYFHKYVSTFLKKQNIYRSVESWHAYPYSTCRQVKISFLGMPQIAHFQVEKWKNSLPWDGGHPPPTPTPRSVATLPRKDCAPPPNVLAHYATVCVCVCDCECVLCVSMIGTLKVGSCAVKKNARAIAWLSVFLFWHPMYHSINLSTQEK